MPLSSAEADTEIVQHASHCSLSEINAAKVQNHIFPHWYDSDKIQISFGVQVVEIPIYPVMF